MNKKVIVCLLICVVSAMFVILNTDHHCAKNIIRGIESDYISKNDFEQIVKKNKKGIDAMEYSTKILEAFDLVNYTPLCYACKKGDYSKVKILLENGSDPNVIDGTIGRSPLLWALESGQSSRYKISKLLLAAGADPCLVDTRGYNALYESLVIYGDENVSCQLYSSFDLFNEICNSTTDYNDPRGIDTILGRAATYGNVRAMKYILNNNVCGINTQSECGRTALMSCVYKYDNSEICTFLIELGADKRIKDCNGYTAYDYAVKYKRTKCIKLLK